VNEFEREVPGIRLVQPHRGDNLQAVAARELGDANRWPELVWLNALKPPYLTDDPLAVTPGVVLTGGFIRVPAPGGSSVTEPDDDGQAFERDCVLVGKALVVDDGGDLAVIAGTPNLKQQLQHRINTPRGQLQRHPEYGCRIWSLLGTVNGPTAGKLGAEYVKSALRSDYRVSRVASAVAEVVGDSVRVTARAEAIAGDSVGVEIQT
jgi:phage baseplate assembly protein W